MTARRLPAVVTLAIAMLLAAVLAAPAQAAPGYSPSGESGSELPLLALSSTGPRIAVDDVTGDVLVAPFDEVFGSPPGIFIYRADGTYLGQFGEGSINAGGIAIDQTNGDLYVADVVSGRILRFTTDRADPPTYTPDGTYSGPAHGSDYGAGQIGSLLSAISIDPTNRDLLVADSGGLQVDRYAADGTFLGSFNGASSGVGPFTSLLDVAVDPTGRIYVVQDGVVEFESGFFQGPVKGSQVARYAPDGSGGSVVTVGEAFTEARAVGVDPANGLVTVVTGGSNPLALWTFTSDGSYASTVGFPAPAGEGVTAGVAIDPASGRLYSATGASLLGRGTKSLQIFDSRAVPGVAIEPPGNIGPFAVHLAGLVTPVGKVTSYYFEYSSDGGVTWSKTATKETPSGEEAPVEVSADAALEPMRTYEVRLAADDGESSNASLPMSFSTPAAPPSVQTGPTIEIEPERVHVEGTVNPQGNQSTYHFEYGTTTTYGARAPIADAVAGMSRQTLAVGIDLHGLAPGTVYHYRLVATNSIGITTGEDRTFETLPVGLAPRAFELVSPIDNGGVSVETLRLTALASDDGNAMLFGTEKGSYPGAESTPYIPRVRAVRTKQGWKSMSTDPPESNEILGQQMFIGTVAVSADQTRALVVAEAALTPGAVAGQTNLYIRNLQTNSYTFVATGDLGPSGGGGDKFFGTGYQQSYVGGSSDLSTVVFMGGVNVAGENYPHAEAVAAENMYEWTEASGLSLVSVEPNGSPFSRNTFQVNRTFKDPNQVSGDGRRIYFGTYPIAPGDGLYLREGGKTTLISVSHRPGDPRVPVPAVFDGASPDGRYVIFTIPSGSAPPLTPDAPETLGVETITPSYQYDAVSGKLTYLANQTQVLAVAPQNEVLVYQDTFNPALPDAPSPGEMEIVYEHTGVKTLIGTEHGSPIRYSAISPNGRYFAFISNTKFTVNGSESTEELYLYDGQTGELTCPSCQSGGRTPTGTARIGQEKGTGVASVQRHGPRAVLDNGTVFFDTPDSLVPRDSNGERDVYSYRDGHTTMISRGSQVGASEFVEASPDGSNVFFTTDQRLVPQDNNNAIDLYDARIGGGFAAGSEEQPKACSAQCSNAAGAGAAPVAASEVTSGVSKRKTSNQSCKKKSKKKSGSSHGQCRKPPDSAHHRHGSGKKKAHAKKGAGR